VVNNAIYGMTGGQISPTTPRGMKSTTTPKGHFGRPFDTCDLACAAGATYVARSIASDSRHMQRMMREGLEHKGFSMIEIISNCHTAYGRINKLGDHLDMLQDYRARAVTHAPDLDALKAKEEGRIVVGLLHREEGERICPGQVDGTVSGGDHCGEKKK
jgi:2-oxoglutarate ferredoxin oxidoreductase subunit beta